MGRTATKSFETIATFLRDFCNSTPQTTTNITEGLALIPSLDSLAQSTVNRCVVSPGASFYGIVPTNVPGSSRTYYAYSAAVAKEAKSMATKQSSRDYLKAMAIETPAEEAANVIANVLKNGGIEPLSREVAELQALRDTNSEWFINDEAERLLLTLFREVATAYGKPEKIYPGLAHYARKVKVSYFTETDWEFQKTLNDPNISNETKNMFLFFNAVSRIVDEL